MTNKSIIELRDMLSSQNANTRYEACYQLSELKDVTSEAIEALIDATIDTEPSVAQAANRALKILSPLLKDTTFPLEEKLAQKMAQKKGSEIDQLTALEIELKKIIIVTTPSIESRKISEYLNIVTAEVVLGTGFLSELDAGISDLLGARANMFEQKLEKAKNKAIFELRYKAYKLHANAILGVDLDYATISRNMLMVVANGTAVKLEETVN